MEGDTKLKLIKKYDSEQTSAYQVTYDGTVTKERKINNEEEGKSSENEAETKPKGEEEWTFNGNWTNPEGGSFGQFRCFREAVGGFSAYSTFCVVCQRVIRPGETRYVNVDTIEFWACCEGCEKTGSTQGKQVEREVVLASETAQGGCCAAIASDALQRFASRPFLGTRSHSPSTTTTTTTATTTAFTWLSYADVALAAQLVAVGVWKVLQSATKEGGASSRPVFVLVGDLSPAYVCVLLGGLLSDCVLVPLHSALEEAPLASCLSLVQPAAVFVGVDYIHKAIKAIEIAKVAPLLTVALKHTALPQGSTATSSSSSSFFDMDLEGLAAIGAKALKDEGTQAFRVTATRHSDEVSAILFTSGSSGEPKGVAYTERLLKPSEGSSNVVPLVKLDIQPFHPSFIISLLSVMHVGGRRAISTDLGTVLEDAKIARPTHISAPPIFWTMLQREHAARMARLIRRNANVLPIEDRRTNSQLVAEASREVRLLLGNRLVAVATGGAAVPSATLRFVREQLDLDLADLYGSRETGGIARDGVIYPDVDVVLLDVPSMGYYAKGDPPRGEIVVHSNRLFSGYFQNDTATSAAFVDIAGKRYYRTGDIGEFSGGGKLRVIDRCGSVVKLAQSEWLSPTRIEIILESSPLVSQALVLGLPGHKYPIAIIVPSEMLAVRMAMEKEKNSKGEDTISPEKLLLRELRYWCIHHHLRPFEVPQAVAMEAIPWTPQNGFLTSTLKKRRGPLTAHYRSTCEKLYSSLEETTQESEKETEEEKESSSISSSFTELLERVLGTTYANRMDPTATLSEIGVDSMASARLATLLKEEGVPVNSRTIHNYSIAHLDAMLCSALLGDYVPLPIDSAATVDWTAEQTLPSFSIAKEEKDNKREDVFITGGTGFLGPHLVAAVLHRFESRVIVLIRADSKEAASKRLEEDMHKAGVWDKDAWNRVHVVVGDLAKQHFGLNEEEWMHLAQHTATIFHSGAKVDVTLPYTTLRPMNVKGTLTIIELALQCGGAKVCYVSSASALPSHNPPEDWSTLDGSELSLKGGYGASKAVAERLLYEAMKRYGLDVRVFRPSAICGDASGDHPWNPSDFSFMLLGAIASMGVSVSPAPVRLHWMPVDWIAQAIVDLSCCCNTTMKVFNLCGEGPSVEECVAALSAAAIPIKSIHAAEWREAVIEKWIGHPGDNSQQGQQQQQQQQKIRVLAEDLLQLDFASEGGGVVPTQRTREVLQSECGTEWPKITPHLLAACAKCTRTISPLTY